MPEIKHHYSNRLPIVRSMVMGANDGLISISALVVGLASTNTESEQVFIVSIIGLLSGAISMGAGEFLSVSAQRDSEIADIDRESISHKDFPDKEHLELIEMFKSRGISQKLSEEIANEAKKDKDLLLKLHLKEELGFEGELKSDPIKAALISFVSFLVGGSVPVLTNFISSSSHAVAYITSYTILGLVILGGFSAKLGGSSILKGCMRIGIIGSLILLFSIYLGRYLS